MDGKTFSQLMTNIYNEIVHWKRNVFLIPSGATGKDFVSELARLLQAYADESSLESIGLKASMVMQVLLLQKPSPRSKAKDHATCLRRRLEMWRNGDIEELYLECKCLQSRMTGPPLPIDNERISRTFSKLMMLGKTKSALQFLFRKADEGVLKLDDHLPSKKGTSCTVHEALLELHPTYLPAEQQLPELASL